MLQKLSYEYIRGLVEGEGCFTFYTTHWRHTDGTIVKKRVPAFVIAMHERDEKLLHMVKETLCLKKNKIYNFKQSQRDGYKRGRKVVLVVREFGSLKNIIVPLFYKRLKGNKAKQFESWLEKIGNEPDVLPLFKFIYKIHKAGFYDRNPKFID